MRCGRLTTPTPLGGRGIRMLVEGPVDKLDDDPAAITDPGLDPELVFPETLGISWAFSMVVGSKQLQQYLSHLTTRIRPANSQMTNPGQECTAHSANRMTPISKDMPQITGLTLITLPVYFGMKLIIMATIRTPMPPVSAAGAQCIISPATQRAMPKAITTNAKMVTCQELSVGTRTLRSRGPAVVT